MARKLPAGALSNAQLAQVLKGTRKSVGLSVGELEKLSGIDSSQIKRVEAGNGARPGRKYLIRLANACDLIGEEFEVLTVYAFGTKALLDSFDEAREPRALPGFAVRGWDDWVNVRIHAQRARRRNGDQTDFHTEWAYQQIIKKNFPDIGTQEFRRFLKVPAKLKRLLVESEKGRPRAIADPGP